MSASRPVELLGLGFDRATMQDAVEPIPTVPTTTPTTTLSVTPTPVGRR